MSEHPYECISLSSKSWKFLAKPTNFTEVNRRQDYQENFGFINGAIYIATVDFFKENRTFIDPCQSSVYSMARESGIDIDIPLDLLIADAILKNRNVNEESIS